MSKKVFPSKEEFVLSALKELVPMLIKEDRETFRGRARKCIEVAEEVYNVFAETYRIERVKNDQEA